MALELYHSAHSTCSQKVRLCLAEKGLDWVAHELHFATRDHLHPEYLELNPNGVVPTLVHDGAPVIESSVICEYLDDVFPEPPLSPRDPLGKARMRAWLCYMNEVPTVAVRVPSFNRVFRPLRYENMTEQQFEAHVGDMPLRKAFYRRMGTKSGFGEAEHRDALDKIRQTAERIDASIARNGGPWVLGDLFSIVDITLTPSIQRMADLGYAYLWEDLPRTVQWWKDVKARPSFAEAFYPGTNLSEKYPQFFRQAGE
jgi:glutathione S-transferase